MTGDEHGWARMGDRWWMWMDLSAGTGDYCVEWKERK